MSLSANARMILQNVLGAGNIGAAKEIGDAIDAATPGAITTKTVITVADANALAVGPNGTTNPTFDVATNTASAATGIQVAGAAAAGGAAIAVLSSGANESMTMDAKGTGKITLNGVGGTGAVQMGGAASGNNATGITVTPNAAGSGVALAVVSSGANENMTLDAKGTGAVTVGGVSTGVVSLGRGSKSVLIESSTETSVSTNGALNITAAAALGGFYIHTGTAGNQTTPTGAQLDAAIPSPANGDCFMLAILPTNAETLVGGSGVTIRGNAAMAAGKLTLVLLTRTGAAAYDAFTCASA